MKRAHEIIVEDIKEEEDRKRSGYEAGGGIFPAPELATKETKVLCSENSFDTDERIKLTLRAAYKLFELQPVPNFGGSGWSNAKKLLDKRHLLMHPKIPADLIVPNELWDELHDGVAWLIEHLFNFFSLLQKKYGT